MSAEVGGRHAAFTPLPVALFETSGASVAWFSHLFGFIFGAAITPLILALRRREIARTVRVPAMA